MCTAPVQTAFLRSSCLLRQSRPPPSARTWRQHRSLARRAPWSQNVYRTVRAMLASQKSYGQRGKVVPLGNLCCPGDDNSTSDLGPCGSRTLPPPSPPSYETYMHTYVHTYTYVPMSRYVRICISVRTYAYTYSIMQAYPLTIGYVRAHGATKRVMGEGIVATFGIVILNWVRMARLFFFFRWSRILADSALLMSERSNESGLSWI